MIAERNGCIGCKLYPCCVTLLVLMHEQLYQAEMHLFQLYLCRGGYSVVTLVNKLYFGVKLSVTLLSTLMYEFYPVHLSLFWSFWIFCHGEVHNF